jgi:hypothetical protein
MTDALRTRPDTSPRNGAVTELQLADVVEAFEALVAERDAQHAAAIEALVAMITDLRSDNAAHAARLDRIDPRPELPGYCSVKAAAGACGYCDETVRRWADVGLVTAVKRGGAWKVDLASVMARAGRRGAEFGNVEVKPNSESL